MAGAINAWGMFGVSAWTSPSPTTLSIGLGVAVVIILVLLVRTASQKKKTEQAAARILSMSENMLSLSSMPISRSEIAGYKLQEKIAEGVGFITYRGVNQHGERCDIKIPTTSALEDKTTMGRLEREAQVLEGMDNPHVLRFKAFEKVKDRGRVVPLLVTEPLDGEELASVIKRVGAMHPMDVISIMLDVASALAAVHRNEVVHRNVKPQSININEQGRAILHNFGVVQSEDTQQLTQRGDVLGTGLYMSPEQITGKALDGRSDLYSLGVVAFEMLTGQPPHAGTTFGELVMRKMTQEAPHPGLVVAGIPQELDDIVSRLMEKEPGKRAQSAGYLITELQMLETNLQREEHARKMLAENGPAGETADAHEF
jgi:serine/threonine-protein kinase